MLKTLLAVAALALSVPAHAAEATAPVRAIMDVAVSIWSGEDNDPVDYFDEAHIGNFSAELRALYAEASRHPAYDTDEETGSPFDYDPIIGGQDGCALKDVVTTEGQPANGAEDVTVTFDNSHCFGERASDWQPEKLVFKMIEEDGRPVIDDIDRTSFEEGASLKAELVQIAEEGAKGVAGGAVENPD